MKISLCVLCSFLLIALMTAPAALAQGNGEELEKQAQEIDQMIMCPVCPAETIDQAQVEISFQMRAIIREMLAEGSTKEEILDYFVDRYGPDILAAPPKSGANLLAWILPHRWHGGRDWRRLPSDTGHGEARKTPSIGNARSCSYPGARRPGAR